MDALQNAPLAPLDVVVVFCLCGCFVDATQCQALHLDRGELLEEGTRLQVDERRKLRRGGRAKQLQKTLRQQAQAPSVCRVEYPAERWGVQFR